LPVVAEYKWPVIDAIDLLLSFKSKTGRISLKQRAKKSENLEKILTPTFPPECRQNILMP
jgi:hypothetical protein